MEIINKYMLKVEFSSETENPSRIFLSMGKLIDSFKSFDNLLAKTISSDVESRQFLEQIKEGSLVTYIIEKIVVKENLLMKKDELNNKDVEAYFHDGRKIAMKALENAQKGEDTSIKVVSVCQNELNKLAENNKIATVATYQKTEILQLAESLKSFADSVGNLGDEENASYSGSEYKDEKINIKKDVNIDIVDIKNSIDARKIENTAKIILLIKKLDLLGMSKWEFKYNNMNITANISDEKWVDKFKHSEIAIYSGDAMEVILKTISSYDKKGNVINEIYEIIEVIDIIHATKHNVMEIL